MSDCRIKLGMFGSEIKLLMNSFIPKVNDKHNFNNPYITYEVIHIQKIS